jgi:hypothetical protein
MAEQIYRSCNFLYRALLYRLNILKAKINLNCSYRIGSYRTVNTLRLGYKNQSVNAVQ